MEALNFVGCLLSVAGSKVLLSHGSLGRWSPQNSALDVK